MRPPAGGSSILRNLTSNWAGIVVNILLSLVLAPITVRSLGNEYYGIWALMMQFTGYLWLFDFGVRESVIKYVAQYHAADDHAQVSTTVHTAVSIYSVVAGLAFAGAAILAFALPHLFSIPAEAVGAARVTALLTGATVAQNFVFNVYVGVLMGLQRYDAMARLGIVFGLVRAVILYALLKAGFGVIALAILQLTISVLSNAFIYRLCVAQLPYLTVRWVRPRRADAMTLLNYGKYALVSNIGDKLIFASDSLVIGMFLPIGAVTYFAIGSSLIDYFRSFIMSLGAMLNPLSSSMQARNDTAGVSRVVVTTAKVMVALGLPVCIAFVLLGDRFISLWMGPEYGGPAGQVLAILAVGHLLGLPYYTISGVLHGLGRHRIIAQSRVFEALANLVLSLVLVRHFGIAGVAIGTVIPHVVAVVGVLPMLLPRLVPISRRHYYTGVYARPLVAALPFAVACWFVRTVAQPADLLSFVAWVAAVLPAYLLPCWAMGLTVEERSRVTAEARRRLGWAVAS